MYAKTDDTPRKLIHVDQDPVRLQQNGFTPKQVDAPETVFNVADVRQPGSTATGIVSRVVVFGEDTPDHIFIDVESKCFVNLLCDPWTSEPWITPLHFYDSPDEFRRRTLGSRFALSTRRIQPLIFTLLERIVESQQR